MREKMSFNRSICRHLVCVLRLSLGVTLGYACYNMSKNLFAELTFFVFRGWLCHPLLITLSEESLLARLLDTKLGQQNRLCKNFFYFDSKLRINT